MFGSGSCDKNMWRQVISGVVERGNEILKRIMRKVIIKKGTSI